MESRFSHDFSDVRVHSDALASASARALSAEAYALGRDVVFDTNRYPPRDARDVELLAHELTHVRSGPRSTSSGAILVGDANDPQEREAEQQAALVGRGLSANEGPREATGVIRRTCRQNANESFYQGAPNYCRDTGFSGLLHPGQTCYREVPRRSSPNECPSGDQVCFDDAGRCHDSFDRVSPVEKKDPDGTCNLHFTCAVFGHSIMDVIPGIFGAERAADRLLCEARCAGVPAPPELCIQSCMGATSQ